MERGPEWRAHRKLRRLVRRELGSFFSTSREDRRWADMLANVVCVIVENWRPRPKVFTEARALALRLCDQLIDRAERGDVLLRADVSAKDMGRSRAAASLITRFLADDRSILRPQTAVVLQEKSDG